jgi:transposase-like protein
VSARRLALARRYGVSENTLYRRRDEFMTAGKTMLLGSMIKLIAIAILPGRTRLRDKNASYQRSMSPRL